jgi:pimeloyl-ACP methyl ester carboxylesterase
MIRSLAVALLVLTVTAGCSATSGGVSAGASVSASPTRDAAGDDCPGSRLDGTAVYIGDDMAGYLAGYQFGTGPVGVVFGHESDGSACDWMYQARALSKQGYTTLALDFDGYGTSTKRGNKFGEDIDDAVSFLGAHGVTSVVLWGSSMGGDAVLAAVPKSSLPVDAVIALSPPAAFGGADAIGAAPHITVPVLLAVGADDSSFAPDVTAIYKATPSRHKQLIVEPTSLHGRQLMTFPDVTAAVNNYLATYAPPAGTQ